MRIGILTSGGDCPGLNAVLRGVIKAAEKLGWQVIGFLDGFEVMDWRAQCQGSATSCRGAVAEFDAE